MSTTPNYAALVNMVPTLRNLVDACGEVTLTGDEAAFVRSLGFHASDGRWRVPPIPPELVRDNPLLENLSIGWDGRQDVTRPTATINRSPEREITREMVAEIAEGILRAIENGGRQIQIRRLQPRFWRFPRTAFHAGLNDLVNRRFVRIEGKKVVLHTSRTWVLPHSHHFGTGNSCTFDRGN